jgi:hypothetical protein
MEVPGAFGSFVASTDGAYDPISRSRTALRPPFATWVWMQSLRNVPGGPDSPRLDSSIHGHGAAPPTTRGGRDSPALQPLRSKKEAFTRSASVSFAILSRLRRSSRSRRGGISLSANVRPTCTGGGVFFRMRRPAAVIERRIPRRSFVSTVRLTAPFRTRRSTTPVTVEGWTNMRAARSLADSPGCASKMVSAQSCGPERPLVACIAFEYSWMARNRRRRICTISATSSSLAP